VDDARSIAVSPRHTVLLAVLVTAPLALVKVGELQVWELVNETGMDARAIVRTSGCTTAASSSTTPRG
jgi:hypothetical protein